MWLRSPSIQLHLKVLLPVVLWVLELRFQIVPVAYLLSSLGVSNVILRVFVAAASNVARSQRKVGPVRPDDRTAPKVPQTRSAAWPGC